MSANQENVIRILNQAILRIGGERDHWEDEANKWECRARYSRGADEPEAYWLTVDRMIRDRRDAW